MVNNDRNAPVSDGGFFVSNPELKTIQQKYNMGTGRAV